MGGYGSGRGSATVTAEAAASYVIIANVLPGLQPGQFSKAEFHLGEDSFAVTMLVVTAGASGPLIELINQTRDEGEGDRVVRDRVRLVSTTPTYGGQRWWFECRRPAVGQASYFCRTAVAISGAATSTRLCLPARRRPVARRSG